MSCKNCGDHGCAYKSNGECHEHHHEHHHGHHHHGHHHHGHGPEGGPDKKELILIIVSVILFAAVFILDKIFDLASLNPGPANWVLPFVCYFFVYLILGKNILKEAAEGILHGEILDENFLMSIASLGAFALGIYKGCKGDAPDGFEEGCAVVILYSIGEFFQEWALGRSRKSVADLMDLRPDVAHVVNPKNGEFTDEEPEHVKQGTLILVKKGEKVPIDGTLQSENAVFDTMALTGESRYETKEKNDNVLSGSVNMSDGEICLTTTKEYANSTVSKILHLVDVSAHKKAKTEDFIARFAKVYTPIVVVLAALVSVAPPVAGLIMGGGNPDLSWSVWIYRGLNFLVVSCPCALVISIPLSYFMGIGTAGRNNILIKGSSMVEKMSKVNIYVSDKTGTLTFGRVLKEEAKDVIDWMHRKGAAIHVLSGDKKEIVESVAGELGIENYHYGLLPEEKVEELEKIMAGKKADDVVAYLGDGINDAPSLIRSDIGISMGSIGSDAAVEASDIVLMKDDLRGIPLLHKISERTMKIVWENIIFSIGIKIIVLVLSAFGITNMWFAVFADVGVALLAVLNALRVGLIKPEE